MNDNAPPQLSSMEIYKKILDFLALQDHKGFNRSLKTINCMFIFFIYNNITRGKFWMRVLRDNVMILSYDFIDTFFHMLLFFIA